MTTKSQEKAARLNGIQARWMTLQSEDAETQEGVEVLRLMGTIPSHYLVRVKHGWNASLRGEPLMADIRSLELVKQWCAEFMANSPDDDVYWDARDAERPRWNTFRRDDK